MLQVRARKFAKERAKNKNIYDDDEVVDIPRQQRNRASAGLLHQAFESANDVLFKVQDLDNIKNEIQFIKLKLKQAKHDHTITLNHYRSLQQLKFEKRQEYKDKLMEKYHWQRQCKLLQPGRLTSLVQANRLLKRAPEIYLIDSERCNNCHIPFKFDNSIFRFRCEKCHQLKCVLYVPEDNSSDTLVLNSKTSGITIVTPKPTAAQRLKMEQTQATLDKARTIKINESIEHYRDFLAQYRDNIPPIPNEVYEFISLRFYPVHYGGRLTVPAIKCIFNKSKEFQIYEKQPDRLRRVYYGQQIPKLSVECIERLVARYSQLIKIATPIKILNQQINQEGEIIITKTEEELKAEEEEAKKILQEEKLEKKNPKKRKRKHIDDDDEDNDDEDEDDNEDDENDDENDNEEDDHDKNKSGNNKIDGKEDKIQPETKHSIIQINEENNVNNDNNININTMSEKRKEELRRKIFAHDIITMMLLMIDGNRIEAEKFTLSKTRSLLKECNQMYLELVAKARSILPHLWPLNDANLL